MNQNIKIALLYSIKTDNAQDFQIDKIDFYNKDTQLLYDNKEDEILQVQGLFGSQQEVQKEVELEIGKQLDLSSYLNYSDKGNLIAIKHNTVMIFCLILPDNFFITKPISEKATEIVLFRILHDFTDNIKMCFNEIVFKDWYQENMIPFSSQIMKRNDYDFKEETNKQIETYDCKWILINYKILENYINSQSLSPQLTIKEQLKFDQIDDQNFDTSYDDFLNDLTKQILNTQNKQISSLCNLFKKEYQTLQLQQQLNSISNTLFEEILNIKDDFVKDLLKKIKRFWQIGPLNEEQNQKILIETQLSDILQTLLIKNNIFIIQNNDFQHKYENDFFEDVKQFIKKIEKTLKNVKSQFLNQKKQIKEDLKKQTYYRIQKINFEFCRCQQEQEKIKNIVQLDDEQEIIINNSCLELPQGKFTIKEVFQTKEKANIYIINVIDCHNSSKCKNYIYFHLNKAPKIKLIKQFDFTCVNEAVYFHDYNRGYLYIFNFKKYYVQQLIITALGIILNENCFCYQQESNHEFIVSQAAYLNNCNQFIVLSKDGVVYKQQDSGKYFEKVYCIIKDQKNQKQTKFIPSIQPDQNYNQLLTCPSGKYFYLANSYCCDRYDQNCLRIDCIQIEGTIKIFYDCHDVIILTQIDKQIESRKAKVISNLVANKKFNMLQIDKNKVIGNPGLDIAKGSFSKFGPNSQFLLKEKKRNIQLYFNQKYSEIAERYLDKLNVSEIILSFTNIQMTQSKSDQIKNIIFSRSPLQLCTIENSNLIPLNGGFREKTEVQKIISVEQKVKQLHLGFLEDHLSNINNKIFVVGILGKQSSGKSYLLNRVFGTRFSVSSARCTDGVWGSIAYVEDQIFLILDCEGLFNGARTEKEEIKMLAFLTAISDITILNSDLTFSRHLNDLFDNLVEASKQLNDEKLFKGFLYFVLRDVSSQDNQGAETELLKNLERLKVGGSEEIIFLNKLFNNKLAVEKLCNNENKLFDQQLINVRTYFLEQSAKSNHWENGTELTKMIKILLCQLELSDNTNASLVNLQISIERIFEESTKQWYEYSLNQAKDDKLKLSQSNYQFKKYEEYEHISQNTSILLEQLYKDLKMQDSIQNHNQNVIEANFQFQLLNKEKIKFYKKHNQKLTLLVIKKFKE
ncbi:unnamed protein product [Paramecium sonneborni]|uniref:VLIG-type G domain-containing protein n=1 Tax=Paramecium sonneborni TaxID=65129 RepID=A0A8S1P7I2_9CILI|nr:unnamed protein product [Paramecium sonneborni]